jgi:hypothetical protein
LRIIIELPVEAEDGRDFDAKTRCLANDAAVNDQRP